MLLTKSGVSVGELLNSLARCEYEMRVAGRDMKQQGPTGPLEGYVDWLAEKELIMSELTHMDQAQALNALAKICHQANANFWLNIHTGEKLERNVGEMLMLCVCELAEAQEGHRKGLKDAHLPHRNAFEVELADCLIRLFDLCGGLGLDIGGALVEKQEYNLARADHKLENRRLPGGKAY